MTTNQILDLIQTIGVFLIPIAVCVSSIIKGYHAKTGKPLSQTELTIQEIADAIVEQYNQLDLTGKEKKAGATEALQKQCPKLDKTVAAGLIEQSYQKGQDTSKDSDDEAQPIGFLDQDNND